MKKKDYSLLFEEFLKLETQDECDRFFADLCTINELDAMLQRIKAARMLLDGKTFQEVIKETNISSATLTRVSKCIKYGDGGYKEILNKKK